MGTSVPDAWGPFFVVEAVDDTTAWLPLDELPNQLDARVETTATYLRELAGQESAPRIAASILSLGLYARLLSPTLGAVAAGVPVPADLLWQAPTGAGQLRLGSTGGSAVPDLAGLLTGLIADLVAEFDQRFSVSSVIGWGNVASALVGSARICGLDVSAYFASPPLVGTGTFDTGTFVRASCCLYYQIGGGYCGDCLLART